MAVIDDILAAAPDGAYEDVNDVIIVDPVTRRLLVPPTEIILGVESDEDAERKYFRCPRNVGVGVDLTACEVHINYENANGDRDHWVVDDFVCDGDMCVFSWKITENVTLKAGPVNFSVCICETFNGATVREWNTTPVVGTVLPGLKTDNLT